MPGPILTEDRYASTSLTDILIAAGANLWTPTDIEQHKKAELQKAPPAHPLWRHRHRITGLVTLICELCPIGIGLSALALLCAIGGAFALWKDLTDAFTLAHVLRTALGGIIGLGVSFGLLFLAAHVVEMKVLAPACWETYPLDAFETKFGPIPKEAREFLARLPESIKAIAYVEVLVQEERALDPVLIVEVLDPQTHYVTMREAMVWDKDGNIIPPPH